MPLPPPDLPACLPPCRPTVSAVQGVLKGYDQLLNMVLDEAIEYLRGGHVVDGGLGRAARGVAGRGVLHRRTTAVQDGQRTCAS